MLYRLIMIDTELSSASHRESFDIGLFPSREDAERTAGFYLAHVKGFCDHPCTYEIHGTEVCGPETGNGKVFMAAGWNINGNFDETDIIESPCFVSEARAYAALEQMRKEHVRSEWAVSCRWIGRAEWSEGFIRDPDRQCASHPQNEQEEGEPS
ncbi:MAG: hypothetical protein IJK28_12995 [Clostridia bacterium]|nr:hypothetical protein [Clostridia bacterium]